MASAAGTTFCVDALPLETRFCGNSRFGAVVWAAAPAHASKAGIAIPQKKDSANRISAAREQILPFEADAVVNRAEALFS